LGLYPSWRHASAFLGVALELLDPARERRGIVNSNPRVSVEEVAKHLGVANDSVYRWIESRALPAHRIDRLWKFRLSEVDDWVRARGAAGDELGPTERGAVR